MLANDTGSLVALSVDTNVSPAVELGYLELNEETGALTYTPYAATTGTDTFGYRVSDSTGAVSNIAIVTVTVTGESGGGLLANNDTASTTENSAVVVPVLANDTGSLIASSVDTNVSPAAELGYLELNEETGALTYTPYAATTGTDTFGYRVSDSTGAVSNIAIVTVTISGDSGGGLFANNDTASTTENSAVVVPVLANDIGSLVVSSVDTNVSPAPELGYLALNEDAGELTYTPYAATTGTDTFGYRVTDTNGDVSNIAVVTVTIGEAVNQQPLVVDDEFEVDINTYADLDVLLNDSDDSAIDASTLLVDVSSLTKGTAQVLDGKVRYTNTDGLAGTDTFSYTVKDDLGLESESATVTVTVMQPAPVANDDSATVVAWLDVLIDVLGNDTDSGEPVVPADTSIEIVSQPTSGTVSFVGSEIKYVHDGSQVSSDSFTYTIEDADQNVSNQALVSISITPHPSVAPEAADDEFSLVRDTARPIPVLANDIDRNYDLDPQSLEIVSFPGNGEASVVDGQVLYAHDGSDNDSDQLTYRVSDAEGQSDEAVVTISYEPVEPPVAVDDFVRIDQGESITIAILENDSANTSLDLTSVFITDDAEFDIDAQFSVNDDGTVTYTHSGDGSIEDSFSYRVRNAQGMDSNEATATVRIKPPLLAFDQLSYVGGFSLPPNTYGESSLNYADGVIEVNGDSLFIVGHDHDDAIAEFEIPPLIGSYEIDGLNSAGAPRQSFSRIINRISAGNAEGLDKIVGLERVGDSLVVNLMEYYDGAGNNETTTVVLEDAYNLSGSSVSALHKMNGAARSAGWVSEIPLYWQQDFGAPYISGHSSGNPIISRLSVGPSAFAVDFPAALSSSLSQTIDAEELQGFSLDNPLQADLDNNAGNNDLWTHLSYAKYGFIVPGTRTYMTLGWSGGHESGVSYKNTLENGVECPGFCANQSEDVYNYYWLWDMDDWFRVQNGELAPYQITPYDYGKFNLPFQTGPYVNEIGGASYDSQTGMLYVSVVDANVEGFNNPPVIAAYYIGNAVAQPGDTIALAPTGEVTGSSPVFRWQEAANSGYYRLKIVNKSSASVVGEFVYAEAEICTGGVCEVELSHLELPTSTDLMFQVRGENEHGVGAWVSAGFAYSGANQAPVAQDDITDSNGDPLTVSMGSSLTIDVLSNDSDADGSLVPGSVVTSIVEADAQSDGSVIYTPAANAVIGQPASFTYTVQDDNGAVSNIATVTVMVTEPPNEAPVAVTDDAAVISGNSVTIDVVQNDTDTDGSVVAGTVEIVDAPGTGLADVQTNGSIVYTPAGNAADLVTFTYTVKDDDGELSNIATVNVRVSPVITAAPFCPAYTSSPMHRTRANTLVVSANDPDWEYAIEAAPAGTEVLLEDGVYQLDKAEYPDANTIFLSSPDVTVRSLSGNRDAVIIRGDGYPEKRSDVGFMVVAHGITIADLSIHEVQDHAVSMVPGLNGGEVQATHIYNIHAYDTGTQHIKGNTGGINRQSVVACSLIGYSDGAVVGDYIGGVDIHAGVDVVVRDNYLYNITGEGTGCSAADLKDCQHLSAPAIYMNASDDSIVERNIIEDSYRGIALGLVGGHTGGIVRNNFVYLGDSFSYTNELFPDANANGDSGISIHDSTDSIVEHNTVYLTGAPQGPIEVRGGAGHMLRNNLTNAPIWLRDGASSITQEGNIETATLADFVAPGDVHLSATSSAINAGVVPVAVSVDIDGDPRIDQWDVGADQFDGTSVNQPPVAGADFATVPANGSVVINVLSNDDDPDGNLVNSSIET
ncbi:MAG: Ig-like domain-containing protein, partial [Pseudomonadota bacterium]